jgi:hypothetical protein
MNKAAPEGYIPGNYTSITESLAAYMSEAKDLDILHCSSDDQWRRVPEVVRWIRGLLFCSCTWIRQISIIIIIISQLLLLLLLLLFCLN